MSQMSEITPNLSNQERLRQPLAQLPERLLDPIQTLLDGSHTGGIGEADVVSAAEWFSGDDGDFCFLE